jgi:rubredoxin
MEQQPSVGRAVHYVAYGKPGWEDLPPSFACRAAIITEVTFEPGHALEGHVGLCVISPSEQLFLRDVPYAEIHRHGTWHWPERT